MVGQYLPKKPKFTFCYSAVERQIFLASKQHPDIDHEDATFRLHEKLTTIPSKRIDR
jgi:hypothetical protein